MRAPRRYSGAHSAIAGHLCFLVVPPGKGRGRALIQQLVYPRGARRPALFITDHVANRQQQSEFGVDGLDVAHGRSLGPCGAEGFTFGISWLVPA
jgi:hypothetical protein